MSGSAATTGPARTSYAELLLHPLWQEKRLRILDRAGFRCERCGARERTLHVHHKIYFKDHLPWEYDDCLLECVCDDCHTIAHARKNELDLIVAQQPTARLPELIEAVATAGTVGTTLAPDDEWNPRMRALFIRLGAALSGGGAAALADVQNQLQDLIDQRRDYLRGSGG